MKFLCAKKIFLNVHTSAQWVKMAQLDAPIFSILTSLMRALWMTPAEPAYLYHKVQFCLSVLTSMKLLRVTNIQLGYN